jgi:hypothetical protein
VPSARQQADPQGRHIHSRLAGTAGRHSFCDTVSPVGDRIPCRNHISATS